LNQKVNDIDYNSVSQQFIDEIINDLCNIYLDPAKAVGMCTNKLQNISKVSTNKNHNASKSWFNKDCEKKRRNYIKFKNKFKKNKNGDVEILKGKSKVYKKFLRIAKKRYQKEFNKSLRNLKSTNPKEYWNILNKGCKKTDKSNNIALDVFMNYFKKLSQKPDDITCIDGDFIDFDPRKIKHSINEQINVEFSIEEIKEQIANLKANKTCGVDYIINEYIKYCPDDLLKIIVKIFNIVLNSGKIPSDWCLGIIKPIF
jgi:hypothetical protein